MRRHRALVIASVVAALLAGVAGVTEPALAGGEGGGDRVRDLTFRVRDLTYRVNALDNSERVTEKPKQTSVTLSSDVLFDYDKSELTPDAGARLAGVADKLNDLGARKVTIGGHTDSDGDDASNQGLSERRAAAVRDALASKLHDGFTFDVRGYGETKPVAPNKKGDGSDNPPGRALNRRVEITFPS